MSDEPAALLDTDILIRMLPVNSVDEFDQVTAAGLRPLDKDLDPGDTGCSVFVLSRLSAAADLAEAINSIEAADSKWVASGVGVFEVGAARQLGIDPTLSPEECEWPTIALGHASLRGLTKQRRGSLLLSIQVKRRPKPL